MAEKTVGRLTGLTKTAKNWWTRQAQVRGLPPGAGRTAAKGATGVMAGLAVTQTVGEMMTLLDDQLTQAARSRDNETANAALGSYSEQTRALRTAASRLSPAEQKVYQRHLKTLLRGRTLTRTANPLFNAKQALTVMKTALVRTSGRKTVTSKKWEAEFERLQASNALSRANPGLSEEQAYRDSFGGTALGIPSGRTDIDKIPRGGKGLAKVGRGLTDPLGALKTGYRWATGEPEPSGPLPDYTVPGPGGTGVPVKTSNVVEGTLDAARRPALALVGSPVGTPQPAEEAMVQPGLKSGAARTYEDFIQAALTKAGFGPNRLTQAAEYKPTPDWASLMGGSQQAAYNPYLGGSEAGIKDVQRRLTGTHQAQEAAFQEDRAFNRGQQGRMDVAADRGLAAYAANQQALGLRQAAMTKTAGQQYGRQMAGYQAALRDSTTTIKLLSDQGISDKDQRMLDAKSQHAAALTGLTTFRPSPELSQPEDEDVGLTG